MEDTGSKYVQIILSDKVHQALKMATMLDGSRQGRNLSIKDACRDAVNSYICYHFDTEDVDSAVAKLDKLRTELTG